MNAKKSKKILLLGSTSLLAAVLGVSVFSFSSSNNNLFAYRSKADNYENLSVTFDCNSNVLEGSIKSTFCVLASSLQVSGTIVKATITNSTAPGIDGVISRFAADTASVYFYVSDPAVPSVTNFQSISSISFGYKEGTQSGNFKVMWSNDNSYWNAISVASGAASQSLPIGAHYIGIANDGGYAQFTSFTINYSCSNTPASIEHNISYVGLEGQDLDGIVPESLEYSAEAGKHVVIEPYYYPLYEFYYANEYNGSYITDFVVKNGVIEFTMPDHDISIEIAVVQADVELDYIVLSGQTTSYSVGDAFEFDGTVTAYYNDGSEQEVEPTDVSEPDMSKAGTPTVTVSYTESGITKTAEYVITVGEAIVTLSGRYNYTSKQQSGVDYDEQYMTFNQNGTGEWHLIRLNARDLGDTTYPYDTIDYHSICYFSYQIEKSENSYLVTFTLTSYDLYLNKANSWSGGIYDRPFPTFALEPAAVNNSCVFDLSLLSFQIDVFQSQKVYNTFTFTKVN